jgi:hypothetical protein
MDTPSRIDRFFSIFSGSIFALVALAGSCVFLPAAIILYLAADPTFGVITRYISELGTGPNNSPIFFYLFTATFPVLLTPFLLFISRQLRLRGAGALLCWSAFGVSVLAELSHFCVVFFPFDPFNPPAYTVHLVLAVLIFFFFGIAGFLFALLELPQPSLPRILPISSLALSVSTLLAALFIALWAVTDIFSRNSIAQITEWFAFGIFFFWILMHAVYFLKNRLPASSAGR